MKSTQSNRYYTASKIEIAVNLLQEHLLDFFLPQVFHLGSHILHSTKKMAYAQTENVVPPRNKQPTTSSVELKNVSFKNVSFIL